MRAVLLDGSRKGENELGNIRIVIEDELRSLGCDTKIFELKDIAISPCKGCFKCWIKTPGICIINDAAREVTKNIVQSDVLILLTPVTFGGYSSELKKALDRSLGIMLPYFTKIEGKTHHKKRYKHYPRLVAIGVLMDPDEELEAIFKKLVSRNAINAHSPGHGAVLVVNGKDKNGIKQDIQTVFAKAGVTA